MSLQGTIAQLSISNGGVPKTAVQRAEVSESGLAGDRQNDQKHHGGPMRAVCLFSLEVINHLQEEGHPIQPGATGDNITISGIEWSRVQPGCRFQFDSGVELEVTSYTTPCSTIRDAFADKSSKRILQDQHPGESRVYAKVLSSGVLNVGERVSLIEP